MSDIMKHKWESLWIPFLLLVFISCGREDDNLRVAYQDRVADAGAILTAEKLSENENYSFKIFSSGSMTAEALISGNADIATMGDAVAVTMASRYPDRIVILGIHGGGEKRHRLVSGKDKPETIAVKFGTSTHAALLSWLAQKDYSPELIDLSPDIQLSALDSGEVDAIAASEPTPSVVLGKLDGFEATSLENEGREYPIVLVASVKAVREKHDLIDDFIGEIRSSSITLSYLSGGEKIDGDTKALLTDVTGLEPDILEESIAFHFFEYRSFEKFRGEFDALTEFMLSRGKIDRIPVWEDVNGYE